MKMAQGIAVMCVSVALATGCGAAEVSEGGTSVQQPAAVTGDTGSLPSTSGTKQPEPDPSARYAPALQQLKDARSVTYSVTSVIQLGTNSIRGYREVSVDASRHLASTRARIQADVPGKPKTDLTMLVVNTADAAFLTMPSWSDARKGKWMRVTQASAASMGVPLDIESPSTVPPGLDEFQATGMAADGTIEGTVDALSGLALLGMTSTLKDPEFAESLTGRMPAIVTVDPDSNAVTTVEITGKGSTVSASSSAIPAGALQQMLDLATATVTIQQTGNPVTITEPTSRDVLAS